MTTVLQELGNRFPDQPRVTVYCQEEPHSESRCEIAVFLRRSPGDWGMIWTRGQEPDDAQTSLYADTDQFPSIDADEQVRGSGMLRYRFNLPCDECGLSTTVRGEKMNAICDTLAKNGVADISLSALTARLRAVTR